MNFMRIIELLEEEKTKKLPANTPGLQFYSSLKIQCSILHTQWTCVQQQQSLP